MAYRCFKCFSSSATLTCGKCNTVAANWCASCRPGRWVKGDHKHPQVDHKQEQHSILFILLDGGASDTEMRRQLKYEEFWAKTITVDIRICFKHVRMVTSNRPTLICQLQQILQSAGPYFACIVGVTGHSDPQNRGRLLIDPYTAYHLDSTKASTASTGATTIKIATAGHFDSAASTASTGATTIKIATAGHFDSAASTASIGATTIKIAKASAAVMDEFKSEFLTVNDVQDILVDAFSGMEKPRLVLLDWCFSGLGIVQPRIDFTVQFPTIVHWGEVELRSLAVRNLALFADLDFAISSESTTTDENWHRIVVNAFGRCRRSPLICIINSCCSLLLPGALRLSALRLGALRQSINEKENENEQDGKKLYVSGQFGWYCPTNGCQLPTGFKCACDTVGTFKAVNKKKVNVDEFDRSHALAVHRQIRHVFGAPRCITDREAASEAASLTNEAPLIFLCGGITDREPSDTLISVARWMGYSNIHLFAFYDRVTFIDAAQRAKQLLPKDRALQKRALMIIGTHGTNAGCDIDVMNATVATYFLPTIHKLGVLPKEQNKLGDYLTLTDVMNILLWPGSLIVSSCFTAAVTDTSADLWKEFHSTKFEVVPEAIVGFSAEVPIAISTSMDAMLLGYHRKYSTLVGAVIHLNAVASGLCTELGLRSITCVKSKQTKVVSFVNQQSVNYEHRQQASTAKLYILCTSSTRQLAKLIDEDVCGLASGCLTQFCTDDGSGTMQDEISHSLHSNATHKRIVIVQLDSTADITWAIQTILATKIPTVVIRLYADLRSFHITPSQDKFPKNLSLFANANVNATVAATAKATCKNGTESTESYELKLMDELSNQLGDQLLRQMNLKFSCKSANGSDMMKENCSDYKEKPTIGGTLHKSKKRLVDEKSIDQSDKRIKNDAGAKDVTQVATNSSSSAAIANAAIASAISPVINITGESFDLDHLRLGLYLYIISLAAHEDFQL